MGGGPARAASGGDPGGASSLSVALARVLAEQPSVYPVREEDEAWGTDLTAGRGRVTRLAGDAIQGKFAYVAST